jgi:glycosyltransferase involved in cell wall biosynthesis
MERVRPTFAAVVVNYNYARFLPRAVESLLSQERPFDEVLVVDDGSTDESLEVLGAYDGQVRVIAKENGGQLSACLAGLRAASADYVYFLDADDIALPQMLARVESALAGGAPVKVHFALRAVDADEHPTGSVFPSFPAGYDAAQMRHDNDTTGGHHMPPTSGNVYRRETLLGLDWDLLDLRDFIDGPASFALPYLGEIVSIDEPLALYRIHGGNHSQWYAPTVELLRHEVDWFESRWVQTWQLLGMDGPPNAGRTATYVLEHELMIEALEGRWWILPAALRYVRGLRAATHQRGVRLAIEAWALALVLPVAPLRRRLVLARRSPSARSGVVKMLVVLLRRFRH